MADMLSSGNACSSFLLPPLAVSGIGVVGGFGIGLDELRLVLEGQRLPKLGVLEFQGRNGMESLPAFQADLTALSEFMPRRSLRRVDRFSRLALLGACLAMKDAGIGLSGPFDRTGVVVATGYGAVSTTFNFLDSFINDGDVCASPILFSNSLHNTAAAHVSILLKITGPCLTISEFELSTASALLTAAQWLADGWVDRVLFGGVDENCPVRGYCWSRFFKTQSCQAIVPLDFDQQTAVMGEGAAFFVLERPMPGIPGKYGQVVDVGIGRADHRNLAVLLSGLKSSSSRCTNSAGTLLLLGGDGHKAIGFRYRHALEAARGHPLAVASCASAYGSLPIGQAFDLAVAGMTIRDGCPSFADHMRQVDGPFGMLQGIYRVVCLKYGRGGEYGALVVADS